MKFTKEHKRKISEAKKGQASWNKGIPQSPEAKEKNRLAHLGKYEGEKNPMYGKSHTEEARFKSGNGSRRRVMGEEEKKMRSKAHKGIKPSDWEVGFKKGHIPWNKSGWINAYFAGLVDGEGHIFISNNSPKTSDRRYIKVGLKIQMVDGLSILKECQSRWGGWIYKRERSKKNPKWQDSYEWRIEAGRAEKVFRDIRPYVRLKKEQIDIVLELRRLQNQKRTIVSGGIGLVNIPPSELKYRKKLELELKSLKLNKGRKNVNI